MTAPRWHLVGALLLLALGLADLALVVSRDSSGRWWVSSFFGLLLTGTAVRWLREIRGSRADVGGEGDR